MRFSALFPAKAYFSRIDKGLLFLIIIFLLLIPAITPRIYSADEIQYFVYLRSLWMDKDLHFENEYKHFAARNPEAYQDFEKAFLIRRTATGRPPNFAPIGCSILWSPFFGCAHLYVMASNALGSQIAADGFSKPYIVAVTFGSTFLGFIGIILLYFLCRRYFNRFDSLWALTTIWLSSSLFFYLYIEPPMSHSCSFFIVSLFIFLWFSAYGERSMKGWFFLGIVGGLMYLVREQNGLFLILPFIEGMESYIGRLRRKTWQGTVNLLGRHLLFVVVFLLTVLPQFMTYKVLNGIYRPAEFVTSHINLKTPAILGLLFSSYHGFISWTPIALLGIIGLILLFKKDKKLALIFSLAFILQLYISASYSTWWAGASYGARRMINILPLLAVGLGALSERLRPKVTSKGLVAIALLFIVWNFFFIIQYSTGMVPREAPISFKKMVYNQFFVVPPRLYSLTKRFIFNRQSFYQIKETKPEASIDEDSDDK
jgi:hypothetical protein